MNVKWNPFARHYHQHTVTQILRSTPNAWIHTITAHVALHIVCTKIIIIKWMQTLGDDSVWQQHTFADDIKSIDIIFVLLVAAVYRAWLFVWFTHFVPAKFSAFLPYERYVSACVCAKAFGSLEFSVAPASSSSSRWHFKFALCAVWFVWHHNIRRSDERATNYCEKE